MPALSTFGCFTTQSPPLYSVIFFLSSISPGHSIQSECPNSTIALTFSFVFFLPNPTYFLPSHVAPRSFIRRSQCVAPSQALGNQKGNFVLCTCKYKYTALKCGMLFERNAFVVQILIYRTFFSFAALGNDFDFQMDPFDAYHPTEPLFAQCAVRTVVRPEIGPET